MALHVDSDMKRQLAKRKPRKKQEEMNEMYAELAREYGEIYATDGSCSLANGSNISDHALTDRLSVVC